MSGFTCDTKRNRGVYLALRRKKGQEDSIRKSDFTLKLTSKLIIAINFAVDTNYILLCSRHVKEIWRFHSKKLWNECHDRFVFPIHELMWHYGIIIFFCEVASALFRPVLIIIYSVASKVVHKAFLWLWLEG